MPNEFKTCECGDGFTTATGSGLCKPCRKATRRETPLSRRRRREQNAPGSHTPKQWFERIEFQNSLCFWCFRSLLNDQKSFCGTKDHLIPLAKGGSNYIENIVAACWPCNRLKGTRTATEFREYLAKHGGRFSALSTITASTNALSFPAKQLLPTHNPPLEVRECVFELSKVHAITSEPNYAERRALLRQQASEIRRLQLVEAGQLTLPIFGDGAAKRLVQNEPQSLVVLKGMAVTPPAKRNA